MQTAILKIPMFLLAAIPLSLSDLREQRIPNVLLFFGLLTALWSASRSDWRELLDVFLGAMLGFVLFWCIWHLSRGRIGLGDVKYASLVGAFCGVAGLCAAVFVASTVGLLVALALVAVDRRSMKARIPFAPFLSIGCVAALILQIAQWPDFLTGGMP